MSETQRFPFDGYLNGQAFAIALGVAVGLEKPRAGALRIIEIMETAGAILATNGMPVEIIGGFNAGVRIAPEAPPLHETMPLHVQARLVEAFAGLGTSNEDKANA